MLITRFRIALAALATMSVLAACSSPDDGPDPAATSVSAPVSASQTPSVTPSPTPSRLAFATRQFCRSVINDQADGLDAITKLVKHPDGKGLTAEDFSVPRENLSEDERIAPPHLQKYLRTQIAVLDDIVAVFNGEGNRDIQTGEYRDAGVAFVLACGKDLHN